MYEENSRILFINLRIIRGMWPNMVSKSLEANSIKSFLWMSQLRLLFKTRKIRVPAAISAVRIRAAMPKLYVKTLLISKTAGILNCLLSCWYNFISASIHVLYLGKILIHESNLTVFCFPISLKWAFLLEDLAKVVDFWWSSRASGESSGLLVKFYPVY